MIVRESASVTYDCQLQNRFAPVLSAHHIKKLVISGIHTEVCFDTPYRHACSLEYEVSLVQDVRTAWDRDVLSAWQIIAHHNALSFSSS